MQVYLWWISCPLYQICNHIRIVCFECRRSIGCVGREKISKLEPAIKVRLWRYPSDIGSLHKQTEATDSSIPCSRTICGEIDAVESNVWSSSSNKNKDGTTLCIHGCVCRVEGERDLFIIIFFFFFVSRLTAERGFWSHYESGCVCERDIDSSATTIVGCSVTRIAGRAPYELRLCRCANGDRCSACSHINN